MNISAAAVRAATAAKIIAALSRPSSSKETAWTEDKRPEEDGEGKRKKEKDADRVNLHFATHKQC